MNAGVLGLPTQRVRYFESEERAIDVNTNQIWYHNLGHPPAGYKVTLVCKTAENGYVAGDEIPGDYFWLAQATDANRPPALAHRASASVITVRIYATAANYRSVSAVTNATVTPTLANWKVKVAWWELQSLA